MKFSWVNIFEKEKFLVATSSGATISLKIIEFDALKLSFFDPSNNLLNMNNIITSHLFIGSF